VSEPDLSRRKRLRDLMWKFGTRLECDVRRLMASPFGSKTIASTESIVLDMTFSEDDVQRDKSEIVGLDARILRGDSEYNDLWDRSFQSIISGDFIGIDSIFFSNRTKRWIQTYTIPVVIAGKMHFFPSDGLLRRNILSFPA
jgi:hypothetical protein